MILLTHLLLNVINGRRFDGYPTLPYYQADDLGLEESRFSFKSQHGWVLSGSRYHVKGVKFKALVVFFHGLGDGRASYTKTIEILAKAGYLVYAYDNTGCMESQGNKIYSFEHTLIDQKYFFEWLENDPFAKGLKRYSVGHSWGGFGAAVSAKNQYKIEKVVDIAGFNYALDIIMDKLPKSLAFLRPFLWINLKLASGKYGCSKASKIINKSNAKILYIQGKDDTDVTLKRGYESLRKEVKTNNIKYILVSDRGHSVYKSKEAEKYVEKVLSEGILDLKSTKNVEMNIVKATEINKELWAEIFKFLEE